MAQQGSKLSRFDALARNPYLAGAFDKNDIRDLLSALDLTNACIRTVDGTISFWCKGNERLYGWMRAEAVGRVTHTLLNTRFPKPLEEIERELLELGSWTGELLHTAKDGAEVWVASHWVLQRNSDGSPRAVIEVNNDITALKRADDDSRYLASIIQSSNDAILSKNLDGIVTSWNPGAERIFGYSAAEMVGSSILRLFPPEFIKEEALIQDRLQQGERIDHYETVRLTKLGRKIAVAITVSPILNKAGRVVGASHISRDISEQKALEESIVESDERQRLALEAGELGICSLDLKSGNLYWSTGCKEILDVPQDYPAHRYEDSLRLIHPEDAATVEGAFHAALTEGTAFDIEYRIVDRAGRVRWIQSKGRARRGIDGKITQIHGTVLDFTRRKQTEEALSRMNGQLQHFAYAAAHDLQEPLRNIALALQLAQLQSQEMDAGTRDLLNTAAQNATRMKVMVTDLLAYSRVLHEDDRHQPGTSCTDVLRAALENLAAAIHEASAEITWEDLPFVKMDRTHLLQIFQNLISNALKYRGPDPPRIHVGAAPQNSLCRLSVSDNGVGIEPEFQERVFGIFKRLRKTKAPGTGLGLALCKRIVEHYGGEIWVESDGIKGSVFFFTTPYSETVIPQQ